MIHHCYDTVPYYTKLFNDGGINPDSIKTLDDLKVLPILSKQIVNANPESFLSSAIPRNKMVTAHTSGTTGSGFVFKTTQEAICEQWAVWWRYRRALGIEYGTLCGQFGGRSVVSITQCKPPFYRWNSPCDIMYFSVYHMSEQNISAYVTDLQGQKIRWIHGYPSSINVLAEYLMSQNLQLNADYVTTGAESLLESQKAHILAAFGKKAYQHYGMSEAVANFSETKDGKMIVDEDFAVTEFIPSGKTESCDIIGTCLSNYAMPFLRYRTNDMAIVSLTPEGRVVTALDGRIEDCILLPNGAKIGRLDHIFKDLTHIREAQIVQKSTDNIQVNVVRGNKYGDADENKLLHELEERLTGIVIDIRYVDALKRTESGKLRFVISEIGK